MAYGDPPGSLIPHFSNRPGPESDLSVKGLKKLLEIYPIEVVVEIARPDTLPDIDFSCNGVDTDDSGGHLMNARDKLLSLVRAPDSTYIHTDERHDVWNVDSFLVVILGSTRDGVGVGLMLADYGTGDQLEIVKRFSDPEFRGSGRGRTLAMRPLRLPRESPRRLLL